MLNIGLDLSHLPFHFSLSFDLNNLLGSFRIYLLIKIKYFISHFVYIKILIVENIDFIIISLSKLLKSLILL